MSNLAIIPARGGSKRIPKKNIRDFLGKPIIAYSIEAAIQSGLFDEVMVSTDSEEIAEIAVGFGATIPFMRSTSCANDFATLSDVIDEVKLNYTLKNKQFERICCILPTAPLLTIKNLQKGYEILQVESVDSVNPIARFQYPIQRALRMKDGKLTMFQPEHLRTRSQDLDSAYYDAAQFYWMRWERCMHGENKYGFELKATEVQDIDNDEDWKLAELKYKLFVAI